jgi:RNA polymerase sigma factor (TIGR02999 family)
MYRSEADPSVTTQVLLDVRGDAAAVESSRRRLFGLVYEELRDLAGSVMRGERKDHTLSPTALVHEVYLRLIDRTRVQEEDRARFFAIAARAMHQVLIDHARGKRAAKRGGTWRRVTLEAHLEGKEDERFDLIALHEALEALARVDARAAQVVEMRIFAGLTHPEIAVALGVSPRTVDGDWLVARHWLSREMGQVGDGA